MLNSYVQRIILLFKNICLSNDESFISHGKKDFSLSELSYATALTEISESVIISDEILQ